MRRRIIVVAAVALVVVGCAGGDGAPSPTITPTTTPSPDSSGSDSPTSGAPAATTSTLPGTTLAGSTTLPPSTTTATTEPVEGIDLELVADGFDQPVLITAAPGDRRLFVVDQPGRVWVLDGGDPEIFLDITDRVVFGGEQGLLGLAFPPDYTEDGRFFVDYVANGDAGDETRISSFDTAGGVADPASEQILLTVPQPAGNHNGGMIGFGPDGYLWVAMGDGGGSDDAFDQGQDATTLLGAMLRIAPDGDGGYTIPDDNPFADGSGGAPEVWAFGLRNPWRFAFDGDELWIGDVGQGRSEEVDVLDVTTDAGANLGWPRFEGFDCHLSADCADEDLTPPVFAYGHDEGCSITGGAVYRGEALAGLAGHYFFGDFCGGWVRSLVVTDGSVVETHEWLPPDAVAGLTSFGVDDAGELYIATTGGSVHRLVAG